MKTERGYWLYWGKAQAESNSGAQYHLLPYHCLDVAAVGEYFNPSTRPLGEAHAGFAPAEGMFSVAAHVAHVAQTIEWFYDSAFSSCWRMEFEEMDKEARAVASLAAARDRFERAVDKAIQVAGSHSAEEWASSLPANPIMGERPRHSILGAVTDHTARHRGALTVYQRLLGLTPPMPYMDM